jgi:HEAT repeat protein
MSCLLLLLLPSPPTVAWGPPAHLNSPLLVNSTAQQDPERELKRLLAAFDEARVAGLQEQGSLRLQEIAALGTEQSIDALTDLVYRLDGRFQFAAVHAIAGAEIAYAHERLRDLASDRMHPRVRRQAVRDLAASSEGDRLWLRDKRLRTEEDPMLRAEMLRLLLDAEVPRLETAVIAAAKSDEPVEIGVGLEGVGKLRLRRGLPAVKKSLDGRDPVLRRAAIDALAAFGGPRATTHLLDAYADPQNLVVRSRLEQILWDLERPEEIAAVAEAGLTHLDQDVRRFSAELLTLRAHLAPKACLGQLHRLLREDDPALMQLALEGLLQMEAPGLASAIGSRLRKLEPDDPRVADLLWGIDRLGEAPPRLRRGLAALSHSSSPAVRLQATRLLSHYQPKEDLHELAVAALTDDSWVVRVAAVECLRSWRLPEDLPLLIDQLATSQGRTREAMVTCLEDWTGRSFGANAAAWEAWSAEQVEWTPVAKGTSAPQAAHDDDPTRTVALRRYHGLPVGDGGLVFLLDASGSMEEAHDRNQSHFAVYASDLMSTLGGLPAAARFDLVLFGADAQAWRGRLQQPTTDRVDEAARFLKAATLGGPTNLHDALTTALAVPEAETLYLLSDGDPTAGPVQDHERLLRTISRVNRHRGVRIHTIAVGEADLDFLARLAAAHEGKTVDLREGSATTDRS